ncbi:MAG: 2-keto-4-pentenoate hydratase/2-oxohepta-3-ene-1,7-dioic acid hydratase in catechol pathway [Glaciecola sp.]|jgi:2-keto-4-pentenoate hydratase/2-oxohepta-3-ene-1,7-dioic acid hydratase in catechol pathway
MLEQASTDQKRYQHKDEKGKPIDLPVGKVVCVGRNYMDHIEELGSKVSEIPLLFMKPSTAIVDMQKPISIPSNQGECHNEIELAVLISKTTSKVDATKASESVCGIALALDLTLRDEQTRLKSAGQPWERAKSFDGSCPLSPFIIVDSLNASDSFSFSLSINDKLVQLGNSKLMLTPILQLLAEISQHFTLLPGDVVLTGTPKGVGPLKSGDAVTASLNEHLSVSTRVISQ